MLWLQKKRPRGAFDKVVQPGLPAPRGLGVRFRWPRFLASHAGKRSVPSRISGHPPLSGGIQGQAQAVVRVTVRRSVRVAVRRPAIRRVVVPTATTVHAVGAF
jgi:hypothetical protein